MMADQALASIGTALCETGQRVDAWSRLFSAAALLACALPAPVSGWPLLLAGVLLAGVTQLVYALRTSFDRPVFALWASQPEHCSPAGLVAFDHTLRQARLAKAGRERSLAQRVAGVRRLLQRQLLALGVQIAGMGAATGFLLFR